MHLYPSRNLIPSVLYGLPESQLYEVSCFAFVLSLYGSEADAVVVLCNTNINAEPLSCPDNTQGKALIVTESNLPTFTKPSSYIHRHTDRHT